MGQAAEAYSETVNAIANYCKDLDSRVKSATDNAFDLKVLVPLAAATLGLFTFGEALATPL
jgi:hypothetical protein